MNLVAHPLYKALALALATTALAAAAAPPPPTSSAEFAQPPAPALAAPDPEPQGGTLVSLRVPGSALRPRESNVSYTVNGSGGCSYVTAGSTFTVWNYALTELPQGARVDTLRMYYSDTSASNTTAWFTVYDLYGAIVDEWSVSSSTSAGNSFNDSAAIDHVINYATYSYLLNWRPNVSGSTIQLCGFRVFYAP